jgi:hypothetical protein
MRMLCQRLGLIRVDRTDQTGALRCPVERDRHKHDSSCIIAKFIKMRKDILNYGKCSGNSPCFDIQLQKNRAVICKFQISIIIHIIFVLLM